jgi:hypothetical protein
VSRSVNAGETTSERQHGALALPAQRRYKPLKKAAGKKSGLTLGMGAATLAPVNRNLDLLLSSALLLSCAAVGF